MTTSWRLATAVHDLLAGAKGGLGYAGLRRLAASHLVAPSATISGWRALRCERGSKSTSGGMS